MSMAEDVIDYLDPEINDFWEERFNLLKNKNIWMTRDKRKINIDNIEESHIVNIINFLQNIDDKTEYSMLIVDFFINFKKGK